MTAARPSFGIPGWIIGGMVGAAVVAIASLNHGEAVDTHPVASFAPAPTTPVEAAPGGLVSLSVLFVRLRPECKQSEDIPLSVLFESRGSRPMLVTDYDPQPVAPVSANAQKNAAEVFNFTFRVPPMAHAGPAEVWLVSRPTCGSGPSPIVRSPHYPLLIQTAP